MKAYIAIGAVLALLALPGAMAATSGLETGLGATLYLDSDSGLWTESNGCPDLQTTAGTSEACGDFEPDTPLATLPQL
jgi:hypothetical protein